MPAKFKSAGFAKPTCTIHGREKIAACNRRRGTIMAPTNYEERFARVTTHIYDHLDDDIDLAALADIACLSSYHWHRIYAARYGETITATVKRLRLHRASGFLAHTSMPIDEIAIRSGYADATSFTRAFRTMFDLPPADYRENGSHRRFQLQAGRMTASPQDVEIKILPSLEMVSVPHAGSYMLIGKAFDTLFGRLIATGRLHAPVRSIGLFYDDPSATPEADLRSRACATGDRALAHAAQLDAITLRAGRYAVLRHKGPYADMKDAYRWFYGGWLVHSGETVADAPVIEEYLNSPRDTASADLLTDICLPIA
jgi:AraC family transcriptional regulator